MLDSETKKEAMIDGEVVPYDVCLNVEDDVPQWIEAEFIFLGVGVIFTTNGIRQKSPRRHRFYREKKRK